MKIISKIINAVPDNMSNYTPVTEIHEPDCQVNINNGNNGNNGNNRNKIYFAFIPMKN